MSSNKLAYIEVPATSTEAMKAFYGSLFGWSFQDWVGDYTAFSGSGVDGGFHAGEEHRTKEPLVIIETDNIQAMEERVQRTGGTILCRRSSSQVVAAFTPQTLVEMNWQSCRLSNDEKPATPFGSSVLFPQ